MGGAAAAAQGCVWRMMCVLSDLERQYRQARKALERERIQDYTEREEYLEADDKMIYRRDTYRGPVEKTVAAWSGSCGGAHLAGQRRWAGGARHRAGAEKRAADVDAASAQRDVR